MIRHKLQHDSSDTHAVISTVALSIGFTAKISFFFMYKIFLSQMFPVRNTCLAPGGGAQQSLYTELQMSISPEANLYVFTENNGREGVWQLPPNDHTG